MKLPALQLTDNLLCQWCFLWRSKKFGPDGAFRKTELGLQYSALAFAVSPGHLIVSVSTLRSSLWRENPAKRSGIKVSDVPETIQRLPLIVLKAAELGKPRDTISELGLVRKTVPGGENWPCEVVHHRPHQLANSVLVGAQRPSLQTQQDVVLRGRVEHHHLVDAAGHTQSCKLWRETTRSDVTGNKTLPPRSAATSQSSRRLNLLPWASLGMRNSLCSVTETCLQKDYWHLVLWDIVGY